MGIDPDVVVELDAIKERLDALENPPSPPPDPTGSPELEIRIDGIVIIPGSRYDIGTTQVGQPLEHTLTFANIGDALLDITTVLIFNPYSITDLPPSMQILPGEHQDFTLMLDASVAGTYAGNLAVMSGAGNFNAVFEGIVSPSPIEVRVDASANTGIGTITDGTIIEHGGTIDFGTVLVEEPNARTFSIVNNGNAVLGVTHMALPAGYDLNGFTGGPAKINIGVGLALSAELNLDTAAPGSYNGQFVISNDSANENYIVNIVGEVKSPNIDPFPLPNTSGNTVSLVAGDSLQIAINDLQPGQTLELEAGATWSGNFSLPARDVNSEPVIIRSSTRLPDGRVSVANADDMPKIVSPNTSPAITAKFGANGYCFVDIELGATVTGIANIVILGYQSGAYASNIDDFPQRIAFKRCLVRANDKLNIQRAFNINGANLAITQCYIAGIAHSGADSQAIAIIRGQDNLIIHDNYLEAAGENILIGGSGSQSVPDHYNPSGLVITRNHFFKPMRWKKVDLAYDGHYRVVKNLLEFKSGRDIIIANNVFENCWEGQGQTGPCLVITPRDAPIANVTFENNFIKNVYIGIAAAPASHPSIDGLTISNNVFSDVGYRMFDFTASGGQHINDLTVSNNTALHYPRTGNSAILMECTAKDFITHFVYKNNVITAAYYGIIGTGSHGGNGFVGVDNYCVSYDFNGNLVCEYRSAMASQFPTNDNNPNFGTFTRVPAIADVGFADIAFNTLDDFRISGPHAGRGANIDSMS